MRRILFWEKVNRKLYLELEDQCRPMVFDGFSKDVFSRKLKHVCGSMFAWSFVFFWTFKESKPCFRKVFTMCLGMNFFCIFLKIQIYTSFFQWLHFENTFAFNFLNKFDWKWFFLFLRLQFLTSNCGKLANAYHWHCKKWILKKI